MNPDQHAPVLLVRAPFRERGSDFGVEQPLELLYLHHALRDAGIPARIIDLQVHKRPLRAMEAELERVRPRIVGVSSFSLNYRFAKRVAAAAKGFDPEILTVCGGIHASALPEEVLSDCPDMDVVVVGEGERALADLAAARLGARSLDGLPGLALRRNGRATVNPHREFIADLDELPFNDFELNGFKNYLPLIGNFKRLPSVSMATTRGCPFHCTYCSTHDLWRGTVRKMSAERILDEIERLAAAGIRDVRFNDDTFTLFRDRLVGFCRGLIERKLDLTWNCYARIDTVDDELLELMAGTGCYLIKFGIESGSARSMKQVRKGFDPGLVIETVEKVKRAGIVPKGSFIIGVDGETDEERQATVDFGRRINLPAATFNVYSYLPGSADYKLKQSSGEFPALGSWPAARAVNDALVQKFGAWKVRNYRAVYLNPRWWTASLPLLTRHFLNRPWKLALAARLVLKKLREKAWS